MEIAAFGGSACSACHDTTRSRARVSCERCAEKKGCSLCASEGECAGGHPWKMTSKVV